MKILDCTLRDGGYYNNWNFDQETVTAYLNALSESGIDYVELGLRNFPKPGFLGAFAYTSESFLSALDLPNNLKYGAMVDSKTLLSSELPIERAVKELFTPKSESKLSLVRVASHFFEILDSKSIAQCLKELGYTVGFNMMQAGGKPSSEITTAAREIASWNCVDVLYFADSLGNMAADEVTRISTAIREGWKGEIGIHTHDNMGKGLENSLTALKCGVEWLDCTVTGMGRGAGNTQTERLLSVLSSTNHHLNPNGVYELVIKHFEPMQKNFGWGCNLLYFLGAQKNVHPTYIQNLLSDPHLGRSEVVGALQFLLDKDGTNKYDGALLEEALNLTGNQTPPNLAPVTGQLAGQTVLLLTNAPSVREHTAAIELFIKKHKPKVISLNILDTVSQDLVDFVCISHNFKYLSEKNRYSQVSSPFILPKHKFSKDELSVLPDNAHIDYGMITTRGKHEIHPSYCVVPSDLTLAYAISYSIEANADKIYVAGIDGYDSDDPRQAEMIELMTQLDKKDILSRVIAITPTTYPAASSSVYAYI